ncbi:Na+/H+ antiporter subunit C (plasmid) [Photobacterium sp. DA100]|uniref:Na+/H+ antiporter subunit C n=1 Tax=Photobacterium sp. DA100 TaxID=3027472 RepID=UPI00247AF74E|nr:Na+/H+ antiporter subunit C [Photobacterium sp. DA100]WEM44217.1 Na+/H+ antiporter subunit C [Photobacterium sp. DA100]
MEILWSLVVGVFVTAGVYLMLERHIIRILLGLILISNAVNLAIFTAGRLTPGNPPLIDLGSVLPPDGAADPLPQALILTAIVIGFGLLVFALMLLYRAYIETGSADVDAMQRSEEEQ